MAQAELLIYARLDGSVFQAELAITSDRSIPASPAVQPTQEKDLILYFGSVNHSGASDAVFAALAQANQGISAAYGDDEWTQQAVRAIQTTFDSPAEVFFVSTGTAANALALACMSAPWQIILCHAQAHILNDELTAPEFFTGGARMVGLDAGREKLSLETLNQYLSQGSAHPPHNAEPAVLSLTQVTESGQVYSIEELTALCAVAHQYGLAVHMDGARFANAVAGLDCHPAAISWQAGVDVLSLGATKNGALSAEAIVFFNRPLAANLVPLRKRSGHLVSKGRWLGAQFSAWLNDGHWLELAAHANRMATLLEQGMAACPASQVIWPVAANEVFAILPRPVIEQLRAQGAVFYQWPRHFVPSHFNLNEHDEVVRLVTSFRTNEADVTTFLAHLNAAERG